MGAAGAAAPHHPVSQGTLGRGHCPLGHLVSVSSLATAGASPFLTSGLLGHPESRSLVGDRGLGGRCPYAATFPFPDSKILDLNVSRFQTLIL